MSEAAAQVVRSVLIPLKGTQLLLPNVVVAEVMSYSAPMAREDAPEWLLGDIVWRGTSVPIVSMECLMGDDVAEPVTRSRTLIFNTLNGRKSLPYIGIVTQSIPSLVRVSSDNIIPIDTDYSSSNLINLTVEVEEKKAVIPDMDVLENILMDFVS